MGLLNSALQIGRSALFGYQGALQVIGNNISSVGSPDYTRLSPELDPLQGNGLTRGLQPGAGVALTGIRRNIDEALESRVRSAISEQQSVQTQRQTLAQVETLFDDQFGAGIATRLQTFFNNFDELQNTPDDLAIRSLVLSSGSTLAESLQGLRRRLAELGTSTDGRIAGIVNVINRTASEIADLNAQITRAEAGGRSEATSLRDQRDALLRSLSELVAVTVREQPDGSLNVYVGNEVFVQGAITRDLIAVERIDGEFMRTSVRFVDTNAQVPVTGGVLEGLFLSRDESAFGRLGDLDALAEVVITEVNRIHADGQGLVGYRSLVGSQDVLAVDTPLDGETTGLTSRPGNGSFFLTVADDATGTPLSYRIDVDLNGTDSGTTLASLVDAINDTAQGVTASVTADQRLSIVADAGFSFRFGFDGQRQREDTSGVLAALGMNTFFTGSSARDIAVNGVLVERPSLLAAASANAIGDGSNAGRLAALDTTALDRFDGNSILGNYQEIAGKVAVAAATGADNADAAEAIFSSLKVQKESISGVNLDEEAIALLKYQRAFQGTSRFISVVDDMLGELIALVR